jgi:hypothetical protein
VLHQQVDDDDDAWAEKHQAAVEMEAKSQEALGKPWKDAHFRRNL